MTTGKGISRLGFEKVQLYLLLDEVVYCRGCAFKRILMVCRKLIPWKVLL